MAASARSILVIDDDVDLCSLMTEFFAAHDIAIETEYDGRRGLARALEARFDLIILDGMLPVLDGFELLRQLRKRSAVPVIMLTARTAQKDRVLGLNAGADDYLPKPFGPEELLARVRAVLRRSGRTGSVEAQIESGGLTLDTARRTVCDDSRPVPLTALEYDILEMLMRSAGRVVSREAVSAVLHQRETAPFERSLDVHISHLRKKLGGKGGAVQTVRGVGYVFAPGSEA